MGYIQACLFIFHFRIDFSYIDTPNLRNRYIIKLTFCIKILNLSNNNQIYPRMIFSLSRGHVKRATCNSSGITITIHVAGSKSTSNHLTIISSSIIHVSVVRSSNIKHRKIHHLLTSCVHPVFIKTIISPSFLMTSHTSTSTLV